MVKVWAVISILLLGLSKAHARDTINVAVTASFKPVLEVLAETFEREHNVRINLSSASTGILYQQILSGAPFDVFFAADAERPELLQVALNLPKSSLKTYAYGHLVFFSKSASTSAIDDLKNYDARVVIANPSLAPYGVAAEQVLDSIGFEGARVLANNVAQARQYLELGLADVGLIAEAVSLGLSNVAEIDASLYDPIQQDVLVIGESLNAEDFVHFVLTQEDTLRSFGYSPASTL